MPRRRKDIVFEESLFNNLDDYNIFEGRLMDLATGSFNFENMPDEIFIPYVIKTLIREGKALFFKDDILDQYFLYQFTTL